MNTETNSANTAATTKNLVFAPLAMYAAIAVVLVSIIVTTAITLNKQLNTAEKQIATIENEVTELYTTDDTSVAIDKETNELLVATVTTDSNTLQEQNSKPADEPEITSEQATSAITQEKESAKTDKTGKNITTVAETTGVIEAATNDHIDAYKLEQKQHMTDMFARIKALESQQLDQYESGQHKHVEHLREQVAQQQQLIETLISRNKESLELRTANVQRGQKRREEFLNRI